MKIPLLILGIAVAFAACSGDKSTSEKDSIPDTTVVVDHTTTVPPKDTVVADVTPTNDGQVSPQRGTDSVRFMVSFISKGWGIDKESKIKFDQWIRDQGGIQYTASPWGREGEVSYCFPLKNKSAAEQQAFIRDVKNVLTKRDLIVFSENIPCEKRR